MNHRCIGSLDPMISQAAAGLCRMSVSRARAGCAAKQARLT